MNTTWRFLLALVIAVAISACKTTEPEETEPVAETDRARASSRTRSYHSGRT